MHFFLFSHSSIAYLGWRMSGETTYSPLEQEYYKYWPISIETHYELKYIKNFKEKPTSILFHSPSIHGSCNPNDRENATDITKSLMN